MSTIGFNCPGCFKPVVVGTIHKCDIVDIEFDKLLSQFEDELDSILEEENK